MHGLVAYKNVKKPRHVEPVLHGYFPTPYPEVRELEDYPMDGAILPEVRSPERNEETMYGFGIKDVEPGGTSEESELPPPHYTLQQERALYRKVDINLMPILTAMYLVSFLDRGEST